MVFLSKCLRINISCNPGASWAIVESPSSDVGATHVAVGNNVVWVVTKDNKVRKCCSHVKKICF